MTALRRDWGERVAIRVTPGVTYRMSTPHEAPYVALLAHGMSRRAFLRFSTAMAAALALPASYAPRIAAAVATAPRVPVIWLRGQDCGGDTRAFLGAASPTIAELLLDLLSVDYHESIMGPAGASAELSRTAVMERHPDGYIAVVEGAIPTGAAGMYCTVGGRPIADVVGEVCDGAIATIAVGSCAFDGGLPAAAGGPTGAGGVARLVPDGRLISLPGCPVNVENLTATIVHYLTFGQLPTTDAMHRPLFAYGGLLHNQCERRAHFEFGEFATAWGDEASQKGWCLYRMGCKGPETYANCPTVLYAERTSWAVKAGHGCVGCTMPGFWDAMGPAYRRLPSPVPFAPEVTVDQAGLALVGGVAALTMVHGAASYVRERRGRAGEGNAAIAPAGPLAVEEAPSEPTAVEEATATEEPTAPDESAAAHVPTAGEPIAADEPTFVEATVEGAPPGPIPGEPLVRPAETPAPDASPEPGGDPP